MIPNFILSKSFDEVNSLENDISDNVDKILHIEVSYKNASYDFTKEIPPPHDKVKFRPCKEMSEYFGTDNTTNLLDGMDCIDLRENYILQAKKDDPSSKYISIGVYSCKNTSTINNCYPQYKIDEVFEQFKFQLFLFSSGLTYNSDNGYMPFTNFLTFGAIEAVGFPNQLGVNQLIRVQAYNDETDSGIFDERITTASIAPKVKNFRKRHISIV